jgi:hypothetical protein
MGWLVVPTNPLVPARSRSFQVNREWVEWGMCDVVTFHSFPVFFLKGMSGMGTTGIGASRLRQNLVFG